LSYLVDKMPPVLNAIGKFTGSYDEQNTHS